MENISADDDFDIEMVNDYRDGFNDHYEAIINCIATLEVTPNNDKCIDELFRTFHTVKGDARMLMFGQLADFLHSVEESISALRDHKITFTELLGESITLSLDKAKEISESIFSHTSEAEPATDIIQNIFLQLADCAQQEVDPLCVKIIKEMTGFDLEVSSINTDATSSNHVANNNTNTPQFNTEMVHEMGLYIDQNTPEPLREHLGYMRYLALLLETKFPHWQGRTFQLQQLLTLFNDALNNPVANHQLEMAIYTHDMAFTFLPESLTLKEDTLNASELSLMQTHTQIAADFIGINKQWTEAYNIVLQHHEKSDGTGYPENLTHKQICVGAKMLSIVDAFIAMTTSRPGRSYKRSVLTALNEIKSKSGSQFAEELVPDFINIMVGQFK